MAKREHIVRLSEEEFSAINEAGQRFQLYMTLCDVSDQIADIENQADDMMGSFDMSKMAEGILGMG